MAELNIYALDLPYTPVAGEPTFFTLYAGGSSLVFLTARGRLVKIDLRNKTMKVNNTFMQLYEPDGCKVYPLNITMRRGQIAVDVPLVKRGETSGSRKIYYRRLFCDPDLETVEVTDEETLTGITDFTELPGISLCYYMGYCCYAVPYGYNKQGIAILDFNTKTSHKVDTDSQYDRQRMFLALMRDRTTNKMWIVTAVYYWIVGSYNTLALTNPQTLVAEAWNTSVDPGCGSFGQPHFYLDLDGKVRCLYFGESGDGNQYMSKWNSIYVDNGDIAVEFTRDATDYGVGMGSRTPCVIGSDGNKLYMFVHGTNAVQGTISGEEGFAITAVDSLLANPAIQISKTVSLTNIEYKRAVVRPQPDTFLLEDNWNFYKLGFQDITNSKFYIAEYVPDVDIDPDPYDVLMVPICERFIKIRTSIIPGV